VHVGKSHCINSSPPTERATAERCRAAGSVALTRQTYHYLESNQQIGKVVLTVGA
jgi:hypothetical protein